ncbi:acetyl-CoA decarbonylase/synthase complex subunit gamma [candidate division KSB1 bacterium]|nr:acetyl-CoA decarbonylase/synthase complex subunit gamma [candidate division KSB1 bacterium]MBL7092877.1 acetyl-CoA decarbonylase/synthase complex subunit gamma [candidate division KSB1 bacterium]
MALSGLQIQKLLPKTNCKECGSNTCLAFAMKLAAKKAELSLCPYASEEAIQVLGAASEPPVKGIELGADKSLKLGEETVLYRHEKTFVNQTAFAVNINDTDPPEKIEKTLNAVKDYQLERVGEILEIDMVAVTQKDNDVEKFVEIVKKAWDMTKRPLVIRSNDQKSLTEVAIAIKGSNSVLAGATPETIDELQAVAAENGHILSVTAETLDELVALTAKIKKSGFNNLLLQFQTNSLAEQFQVSSIARRAALKDSYKPLGYPSLFFIESGDLLEETTVAITELCKYGGICVLPSFDPAQMAALMTLRLNIYTDPQKPIQVEPKVYPIGEPKSDSPVFLTTNFSLTYFIVSGEIENSGTSAWLVVPECEGMSVLTAWAAGKFSGPYIAKFIKECGLEEQVTTREIIIPGYVAQISGELEESLPGWKALVGPQEASDIESFVKARL